MSVYKTCPKGCGTFFMYQQCPVCKTILRQATRKEEQDIKEHKPEIIKFWNNLYKRINAIIKDFADCSICAYCCKGEDVPLTPYDINKITKHMDIDKKTFLKNYTELTKNNPVSNIIMKQPCLFLKNNLCTIYNYRPRTCYCYPLYFIISIPGYVEIVTLEWCALATHLLNGFLEFYPKYFSEISNQMKKLENALNNSNQSNKAIHFIFPIKYFYKYLLWLESISEEEYNKKIAELPDEQTQKK
jgi:Fe-S-cluster containining protein